MTSFFVKYYYSSQYSNIIKEHNKNNGNIKTKPMADINRKRVSFTKHITSLLSFFSFFFFFSLFFYREFQLITFALDDSSLSSNQDSRSLIQPSNLNFPRRPINLLIHNNIRGIHVSKRYTNSHWTHKKTKSTVQINKHKNKYHWTCLYPLRVFQLHHLISI